MSNIVLIGMMGCGKSTIGQLLAETLHLDFVDTDTLIEEEQGLTIPEIFAQYGEDYFRNYEVAVANKLSQREGLVIACGGGLPLRDDAIAPLKETGKILFLNRDCNEIYDSVSMAGRPLGQGGRRAFLERFAQREPIYRNCAHYEIAGVSTVEDAMKEILEVLA